ncbi:uncharacterized protein V1510DRAFT_403701 [Dipodascopsis tothii]|uniref:uncharacterized protein n=1 Tax=Dipodascopsis tothii TaxID=44089 RepID=UPI0034CDE521
MDPTAAVPAAFPFVTPAEFAEACARFVPRARAGGLAARLRGEDTVEIVRRVAGGGAEGAGEGAGHAGDAEDGAGGVAGGSAADWSRDLAGHAGLAADPAGASAVDGLADGLAAIDGLGAVVVDDDEHALPPSCGAQTEIVYDIVRSPVYQTPALYFTVTVEHSDGRSEPITAVERAVALVGGRHAAAVAAVGVRGAVSQGEHPATGLPAFFVHPCMTAEALAELATAGPIRLDTYLAAWLGIYGSAVGLELGV